MASGCGGAAAQSTSAQPSWVHADLAFVPSPPVARQYETVEVRLVGADHGPVRDARLQWSANMVDMNHPAAADLQAGGAGVYTGRTLFVMGGQWVVTLRVSVGGRSASIAFPFEVRE